MTTDPKQEFFGGWLALNNGSEEKHRAKERHRKTKGASERMYVICARGIECQIFHAVALIFST